MKAWIAREKDGRLKIFFGKKPWRNFYNLWDSNCIGKEINPLNFEKVTFENSPQEVEIKLVKK